MGYARGTPEFDRSLGFFDAVFGFALTLLIANIDLPPQSAWENPSTIFDNGFGTQLVGFIISFIVIVVFWRNNQELVARLRSLDSTAITWNIALVGLIIFLPLTTQGISDPRISDLPLTTALYAVNVSAAILVQIVMYSGAVRRGLARTVVPPRLARAELIDALMKPAVFLVSIPVAFAFGGVVAKFVWLLLLVLGPITGRIVHRIAIEERFTPEAADTPGP